MSLRKKEIEIFNTLKKKLLELAISDISKSLKLLLVEIMTNHEKHSYAAKL